MAAKNGANPATCGDTTKTNNQFSQTERIKRQSLINSIVSHINELKQLPETNIEGLPELVSLCGELNESIWSKIQENPISLNDVIYYFSISIELNPDDHNAYNNRGIAYYDKWGYTKDPKDLELAVDDYSKVIELNPDYYGAYNNRGIAYHDKWGYTKDPKDLELAINDYSKVIELNPYYYGAYNNRGIAYYDKWGYTKDPKDLELAVDDYSKAIELNPYYHEAYNNRGNAYHERWEYSKDQKDLELAINDYSKAIELNPYYKRAYLNRGIVFYDSNQIYESLLDFHVVQYLMTMNAVELGEEIFQILQSIKEETCNYLSIFTVYLEKNMVPNILLPEYVKVREKLRDFLLIFKYIGFELSNLSISDERFQQSLPILLFYLKGCVPSFRLYDDKLDDDMRELSAQDYYYYVMSARQFSKDAEFIGTKAILEDAIRKLESRYDTLDTEEKYYLGLLYFICFVDNRNDKNESKNWRDKALAMFYQSIGLIWSKRMVDVLKNVDESQENFDHYVNNHCNNKVDINIDALIDSSISPEVFMNQFADYCHFCEVEDAYHQIIDIFEPDDNGGVKQSNKVVYHEPMWDVFELSEKGLQKLVSKVSKISALEVFKKVVEELEIKQLTEEEKQSIEDDHSSFLNINNSKDAGKKIIDEMRKGISVDDFELIIRYLYHKGTLDKKQCYTLLMYNELYNEDKKAKRQLHIIDVTICTIISVVTTNPVIITLNGLFSILKALYFNEISEGDKEYIKYSDYKVFSSDSWKRMNSKYYDNTDYEYVNLLV